MDAAVSTFAWRLALALWLMTAGAVVASPAQVPSSPAEAPPLRALVIGNGTYVQRPLANAENDAELMAKTLRGLGFEVTVATNLTRTGFYATARSFAERLPEGAVALVYYAGHGAQVQGANFLTPVDVVPTSPQAMFVRAYPLNALVERLTLARSAVNIVILDACRNDPFATDVAARYRGSGPLGFASVTSPRGMLIAYSTAPGQLAEDGAGRRNSHYTEALAGEIRKPGRTIEEALNLVGKTVRRKTADAQQPWFATSIADRFYFRPPPGVRMVTGPSYPKSAAGLDMALAMRGERSTVPMAKSEATSSLPDASRAEKTTGRQPFPRDTLATTIVDALIAEADAGDPEAACRVGIELWDCRLDQLIEKWDEQSLYIVKRILGDEAQARLYVGLQAAWDIHGRCMGVSVERATRAWQYLGRAALNGSVAAKSKFAMAPPSGVEFTGSAGFLAALDLYRERASDFLWDAIANGDVMALYTAWFMAQRSDLFGAGVFPTDPYLALVYANALTSLVSDYRLAYVTNSILQIGKELGEDFARKAAADGENLRQTYFAGTKRVELADTPNNDDAWVDPLRCGR